MPQWVKEFLDKTATEQLEMTKKDVLGTLRIVWYLSGVAEAIFPKEH